MSRKEKYIIMTSWHLPNGEPLVLAVTKEEATFHGLVSHLWTLGFINDFAFKTSETLIIRDGFQKVA